MIDIVEISMSLGRESFFNKYLKSEWPTHLTQKIPLDFMKSIKWCWSLIKLLIDEIIYFS